MSDERTERLYALKSAAEQIADSSSALGQEARARLVESSGLSPEGVHFALTQCLEHQVARGTLSSLSRRTPRVPRAHVLLSSNVFVATFRAIALALCQSTKVQVRASRREPVMAELLLRGSGGAFELLDELSPTPLDHVWAYGTDETLNSLARTLLPGVRLHRHGSGMGVAVFVESVDMRKAELAAAADALARDTIAFDQKGCLSPRILLIEGSRSFAESVCDLLVDALDRYETVIPRGPLSEAEQADVLWHETTMQFVGSSVRAGKGMVFLDPVGERLLIPPPGRYLHVTVTSDVVPLLAQLASKLTTVGFFNGGHLPGILREKIGARRYVDVGQMQRPVFDGPVDLRCGWDCVVL